MPPDDPLLEVPLRHPRLERFLRDPLVQRILVSGGPHLLIVLVLGRSEWVDYAVSLVLVVIAGLLLDLANYSTAELSYGGREDLHVGVARRHHEDFPGPDGRGPCLVALSRERGYDRRAQNRGVPFVFEDEHGPRLVSATPQTWQRFEAARRDPMAPRSTDPRDDDPDWLCVRDGDTIVFWGELRDPDQDPQSGSAFRRPASTGLELRRSVGPRGTALGLGAVGELARPAQWSSRWTLAAIVWSPLYAFTTWLFVSAL